MKNSIKNNWFKIVGIIILLLALGSLPYGYYQFLRWAITIIGAYSAYLAYEQKNITWTWIFGLIAILFNPIIPFIFAKDTWQTIDVITAIIIIINVVSFDKIKK